MSDFNSFRNVVLKTDNRQDEVMSIIDAATANGSGLVDGIAILSIELSDKTVRFFL